MLLIILWQIAVVFLVLLLLRMIEDDHKLEIEDKNKALLKPFNDAFEYQRREFYKTRKSKSDEKEH